MRKDVHHGDAEARRNTRSGKLFLKKLKDPSTPPSFSRGVLRILLLSAFFSVSPCLRGLSAFAQSTKPDTAAPGPDVNPIRGSEINDAQKRAVAKGLEWLAARQAASGAFGGNDSGQPAAVTSLSALAFMQAGNLPGRGKYGANVRKAVEFVLSMTAESGLIASDNAQSVMYGHGFSTLFLAEVFGMGGIGSGGGGGGDTASDADLKEKLQKAVRLIIRAQNAQGGWRYNPRPEDADISVTICQVMALRAARDAGIQVDKAVVDRAIEYVRNCQNGDGGFAYMSHGGAGMGGGMGGGTSRYALSSAGVASLFYAGVYEGDEIKRGLAFLKQFVPGKTPPPDGESHYFYGNYYAVQAMFLAGGDYWATFYPALRDQIISRQNADGSWNGDFTNEYATAMALIILQMPNRYLPVFIGKGPGG